MTKAQELLSRATLAEQQSPNIAATLQQQVAQSLPQQEMQAAQPDPDMQAWSQKSLVYGK